MPLIETGTVVSRDSVTRVPNPLPPDPRTLSPFLRNGDGPVCLVQTPGGALRPVFVDHLDRLQTRPLEA